MVHTGFFQKYVWGESLFFKKKPLLFTLSNNNKKNQKPVDDAIYIQQLETNTIL